MATSLWKRKGISKSAQLRGTKPSLQNSQLLLVSTGVPSLDALLGGGQCIGTILLIEEDIYELYSRVLLKYFIAEGVMCGHQLLLCSASERPNDLLNELPGPVHEEEGKEMTTVIEEDNEEEMVIAWRYQNLSKHKSSFSNKFGHNFDLTKKMQEEKISAVKAEMLDFTELPINNSTQIYLNALTSISETLQSGNFLTNQSEQSKTVVRIVIQSLGSPLWKEDSSNNDSTSLTRFFHSLRGVMQDANAVAMVTMPTHLFQNESYIRRIERLCHSVVKLESFAGSDKEHNPLYREYHGLFHFNKLPRVQSLTGHYPETLDLAFKLKRKKFIIEKLHLPPELSETVSRAQEETDKQSRQKQATTTTRSIDF